MDGVSEEFVRSRVVCGVSHAEIGLELEAMFPGIRGFSSRSVYRYCRDHDIHYRSGLSDGRVDVAVSEVVNQVSVARVLLGI